MNYFQHHIGDYAEATAHLTFVEDAAYSRMIRKYYATEKPMPVDVKAVQRLIGARTKEEREAVREYGSSDSGASLGDILGAAIRRRREMAGEE